jgi:hypothetical protein
MKRTNRLFFSTPHLLGGVYSNQMRSINTDQPLKIIKITSEQAHSVVLNFPDKGSS